jgi:type I restriction enzyme S subunit
VSDLRDFIVSKVPPGWTTKPLWSLFRRRKLTGYADEELLSVYRDYGVIPKSSRDDNFNKESDDLSGYQLVTEGALVTNKMKAWQGSIAISRYRGIVSPAYYVYEPLSDECDQFLHYLFRSDPYVALYGRISKGVRVNQWDLEHEALRNVPVMLPDRKTQVRIAHFLDVELARIDRLIERKNRFLHLAEERRRATIDHIVCGQDLDCLMLSASHPFIAELPASWVMTPLKHLTDDNRQIMYGIVLPGPNVDEGPIIVKGGDVKAERLNPNTLCRTTYEIERPYKRSRLKAGDLVIAIRGGIGDVEIVPPEIEGANLTQDAARIAPRSGIDSKWLRYALMAPSVFAPLEAKALGAAVRGINIFDLKRVRIPVPPQTDQTRIANVLAKHEQRFSQLRQKIHEHSQRIQEFRSAIVTAAVTGQIDVTSWGKRASTDRRLDQIEQEMSQREATA